MTATGRHRRQPGSDYFSWVSAAERASSDSVPESSPTRESPEGWRLWGSVVGWAVVIVLWESAIINLGVS